MKKKSKAQKSLGFCWVVCCFQLLLSSLDNSPKTWRNAKGDCAQLSFIQELCTSCPTNKTLHLLSCYWLMKMPNIIYTQIVKPRWRAFAPPLCLINKTSFCKCLVVYFFPFASFPGELRYFLHHQAVSGTRISQLQEVTGSLWLSHICANCNLERNKNKIPFFFPHFGLSKHLLEKYQKANQLSESSAENILIAEYFDSYYYRYPSGHTHRNINFLDMITIAKRRFFSSTWY